MAKKVHSGDFFSQRNCHIEMHDQRLNIQHQQYFTKTTKRLLNISSAISHSPITAGMPMLNVFTDAVQDDSNRMFSHLHVKGIQCNLQTL